MFNVNDVITKQSIMNENQVTRRRILIVDDEPFNVMSLKTLLGQFGIENIESIIDEAYNG